MPRLRRLKDYDWEPDENDFPEITQLRSAAVFDEQSNEEDSGTRQYEGYEATTGESWLSNQSVIASIPDDKLRLYQQRYRALLRLLDAEILARHTMAGASNHKRKPRTVSRGDAAYQSVRAAARTRLRRSAKQPSTEELIKMLEMLEALRNAK
jgi:hypothetical protein